MRFAAFLYSQVLPYRVLCSPGEHTGISNPQRNCLGKSSKQRRLWHLKVITNVGKGLSCHWALVCRQKVTAADCPGVSMCESGKAPVRCILSSEPGEAEKLGRLVWKSFHTTNFWDSRAETRLSLCKGKTFYLC